MPETDAEASEAKKARAAYQLRQSRAVKNAAKDAAEATATTDAAATLTGMGA